MIGRRGFLAALLGASAAAVATPAAACLGLESFAAKWRAAGAVTSPAVLPRGLEHLADAPTDVLEKVLAFPYKLAGQLDAGHRALLREELDAPYKVLVEVAVVPARVKEAIGFARRRLYGPVDRRADLRMLQERADG